MTGSSRQALDGRSSAEVVLECIDKTLGDGENVRLDDSIDAVGIGSLQFIQLVVLLEHRFKVEFADEMLNPRRFSCVRDVLDYVESLRFSA